VARKKEEEKRCDSRAHNFHRASLGVREKLAEVLVLVFLTLLKYSGVSVEIGKTRFARS